MLIWISIFVYHKYSLGQIIAIRARCQNDAKQGSKNIYQFIYQIYQ